MHCLVGVESLICMGAIFSGTNSGNGEYLVHDVNFLLRLVEKAQGTFMIRYVLAEKAYLSEQNIGRLHERGWDGKNMKQFYEAFRGLRAGTTNDKPTFTRYTGCDQKWNPISHFSRALRLAFAGLEVVRERTPTVSSSTTRPSRALRGRTKHSAS